MRYDRNGYAIETSDAASPQNWTEDDARKVAMRDESTLGQDAEQALELANQLHQALDDLEQRLFPRELKEVPQGTYTAGNALSDVVRPRVPLADVIRNTRQRLDQATSRLSRIVPRI